MSSKELELESPDVITVVDHAVCYGTLGKAAVRMVSSRVTAKRGVFGQLKTRKIAYNKEFEMADSMVLRVPIYAQKRDEQMIMGGPFLRLHLCILCEV